MSDKAPLENTGSDVGAVKAFEPVAKSPIDQLNTVLTAIDEAKAPHPSAENYVGAFDPKSDQYFVQTDNATVTQMESLSSMFSTGPEIRESDFSLSPIVIGIGLVIGIYLLKGK